MHEYNVAHLDLKPQNVVISAEGAVYPSSTLVCPFACLAQTPHIVRLSAQKTTSPQKFSRDTTSRCLPIYGVAVER